MNGSALGITSVCLSLGRASWSITNEAAMAIMERLLLYAARRPSRLVRRRWCEHGRLPWLACALGWSVSTRHQAEGTGRRTHLLWSAGVSVEQLHDLGRGLRLHEAHALERAFQDAGQVQRRGLRHRGARCGNRNGVSASAGPVRSGGRGKRTHAPTAEEKSVHGGIARAAAGKTRLPIILLLSGGRRRRTACVRPLLADSDKTLRRMD